jgi:phosphohistidine phosphatase SixA
MIVGHQPHLGDLVSWLTSDGEVRNVPLKKGGIASIELDSDYPKDTGVLNWLLTPRQLRQLAGQEQ